MASLKPGLEIGPSLAVSAAFAATDYMAHFADALAGLPEGFPEALDEPMAWTGTQFTQPSDYVYTLSNSDLQEIENALWCFKGLDGDFISRDNFPLPNLGLQLNKICRDVHHGKGFGLIRGLNPQKYSTEDLALLYLGIQSYIANRHGRQDRKGNMLGWNFHSLGRACANMELTRPVHIVADNSSKLKAGHHRHSTTSITFHNEEAGDIISWFTRSAAAVGGKCIIASAHTIYNVLAESHPDLIDTLARCDWPFAMPNLRHRPVLFQVEGKVMINFSRVALIGNAVHPRPSNLPRLSLRQIEALDAIDSIARAACLEISTQPGDIHFVNNLTILHRREGFVNGETPQEQRHLVRMRLRDDDLGWRLPQELRQEWADAFDGTGPNIWHLEPMPDGFFPLRFNAN